MHALRVGTIAAVIGVSSAAATVVASTGEDPVLEGPLGSVAAVAGIFGPAVGAALLATPTLVTSRTTRGMETVGARSAITRAAIGIGLGLAVGAALAYLRERD